MSNHREKQDKPNEAQIESTINASTEVAGWVGMVNDAKESTQTEKAMSLRTALKVYPKAIGWSVAISMAIVMEGYDTLLIGSFYAYPSFQKKYGVPFKGGYQVQAPWQVALSLAATVGVFFGVIANGYLAERFGHKRVLLVSYVLIAAFITITFLAPSVEVLFVGEVLCGLPWGVFSTMAPAYASEVCPVVLRGYLTTFVNLCWVIGHLVAAGVLDGLVGVKSQWSYRIPFAVQWVWPLPLFCIVWFAPESPWWLVRKGRLMEAEHSLKRLSIKSVEIDSRQTVAMMVHTNNLEQESNTGTSWLDCFKGVDLRRTEIACVAWTAQALSGFAIQGYSSYFFEQAGLAVADAYKLQLGYYALGFLGTILSWFFMAYCGRRTIYFYGLSVMTAIMFIIGFLSLAPASNQGAKWATAIMLLLWLFVYDASIGPVAYSVVSEISATRLRGKTVGLARNSYNIVSILNNVAAPYILNPTKGNWKGKAGFLAGGFSFCVLIWAYYRLPEPKGRTYEELDLLFQKRVPARKFRTFVVDPYDHTDDMEVLKPAVE